MKNRKENSLRLLNVDRARNFSLSEKKNGKNFLLRGGKGFYLA